MSNTRGRFIAVLAGAALLGTIGATGAVAGELIGSNDIKNESIRSTDIKDGMVKEEDLSGKLQARLAALEDRVAALEAEDASGVNTNWAPSNEFAEIVDADTVVMTRTVEQAADPSYPGTSVQIQNLDLPVEATKTVSFTYQLADGATYGGGVPRIFWEVDGVYHNTNDDQPNDPGTANGDGTFTKTATIPANGRVGAAGVVYDGGTPGTITVTDVVISGHQVKFQ